MQLISTALWKSLKRSGFFADRCTIVSYSATQGDTGEETRTWSSVSGMVDLPCALGTRKRSVFPGASTTPETERDYSLMFPGRYAVLPTEHRAVVNGETFEVVSVLQAQSEEDITQLLLKKVH